MPRLYRIHSEDIRAELNIYNFAEEIKETE